MLLSEKLPEKIEALLEEYRALQWETLGEIKTAMHAATSSRHYRAEPEDLPYAPIQKGERWGESGITDWFVVQADLPGPDCFLSFPYAGTDVYRAEQTLVFADGRPVGVLDRFHAEVWLPREGCCRIALEAYPSHTVPGNQPHERGRVVGRHTRTFEGIWIKREQKQVREFVTRLQVLLELQKTLPENDRMRFEILSGLERVFACVDAAPDPGDKEGLQARLQQAQEILRPLLAARNGSFAPSAALCAHAHIDTAWQWDLAETTRKCARTFSSVLSLMRRYPEFYFIQSQPYQLQCMREYPALYQEIGQRIAEGRWEINGGMYIEPDLNLPSGESLVRQLQYGQWTTEECFGRLSDTLWVPDTFGFCGSLPQLLQGAGIRYFATGKLAGNDTTRFPYDHFRWRGIDGSEVLACFVEIEGGTGPQRLAAQWERVQHKERQKCFLRAFGHGDGGGGPTAEMLEQARLVQDLQGCPKAGHTTVSAFMGSIGQEGLPVYDGELYFQNHRGTYTSISEIKRLNRRLENAFRAAEALLTRRALQGEAYPHEQMDALWKQFLLCQFHDILPGTAIEPVNRQAVETMERLQSRLHALCAGPQREGQLVLQNTLGFAREGIIDIPWPEKAKGLQHPGAALQLYRGLGGELRAALSGVRIPPLASRALALSEGRPAAAGASPFAYREGGLKTPQLAVRFGSGGEIVSLRLQEGEELVKTAFNAFYLGEDIPHSWDNWNIDADQRLRMRPDYALISRQVAADGPLLFRLRSTYRIGRRSTLRQDMVFYADSPQIDFVSELDWQEERRLLKACFGSCLRAREARHEIPFGWIARPAHENEAQDRAQFEVCQHRWSDLSQADRGLAILNDCKYGISVLEGELGLTLIKSSTHPDTRADRGLHRFTYSLLPHGPADIAAITRSAHALNAPVFIQGDREEPALLWSDHPGVIIDSVKMARHERAVAVRLYEAAGGSARFSLHTGFPLAGAFEADLLERRGAALDMRPLTLSLRPFEVKTLLLILQQTEGGMV